MKTPNTSSQNWDDLVFEHRNKDYGAYTLRQSYKTHVLEGIGAALLFGILVFLASQLSTQLVTNVTSVISGPRETTLILNPTILQQDHIKQKVHRKEPQRRDAVTPVSKTVVDEPEVTKDTNPSFTDPAGTDGGQSFPTEGTGVVESQASPPPVPMIVDHAEVMPAYTGGFEAMMKFLQKNMRYPQSARVLEVQGTVFVQFVVSVDGRVVDVRIIRGLQADCDREAARVIALMPGWSAGLQNKVPVSVRMVLPIRFALGGER